MADLALELELTRSSGVLAGIIASLAQAGIQVQSQKLDRGGADRAPRLAVLATGEVNSLEVLMERMRETRGVSHVARLEVDGELRVADGEPILEPLDDELESDDIAELSAGLDSASAEAAAAPSDTFDPSDAPPAPDETPAADAEAVEGEHEHHAGGDTDNDDAALTKALAGAEQADPRPGSGAGPERAQRDPERAEAMLRRRWRRRR